MHSATHTHIQTAKRLWCGLFEMLSVLSIVFGRANFAALVSHMTTCLFALGDLGKVKKKLAPPFFCSLSGIQKVACDQTVDRIATGSLAIYFFFLKVEVSWQKLPGWVGREGVTPE